MCGAEESGHLRTLYMSPAAQLSGYSHFTMPYYFDHSGAHSNARVGSSARRRHKARTGSGSGTGAASGTGHRTTAANAAGHNAADADEEGLLLRQRPHSSRTRRETIAASSEPTAFFGFFLDLTILCLFLSRLLCMWNKNFF